MVWGFAPGCRDQFCQLKFCLVSEAKATLVAACAGGASRGPCRCVSAPSRSTPGDVGLCRRVLKAVLGVLRMKLESQPVAEVVKTR